MCLSATSHTFQPGEHSLQMINSKINNTESECHEIRLCRVNFLSWYFRFKSELKQESLHELTRPRSSAVIMQLLVWNSFWGTNFLTGTYIFEPWIFSFYYDSEQKQPRQTHIFHAFLFTDYTMKKSFAYPKNQVSTTYSQPQLVETDVISHFCLVCHYVLDTPHWQSMLNSPSDSSQTISSISGRIKLNWYLYCFNVQFCVIIPFSIVV